jgi:tetratricopeptide (TPR) repeat protein
MIDWSLILTIVVIFFLTLIGAYLRSSIKDRCLDSFVEFPVTLEMANGKTVWGDLHLATTGLELQYSNAVQDDQHFESSYVLYSGEYQAVQAIYRYVNSLGEEDRARREKDVDRAFHPRPLRQLARKVRNFMFSATDSLNDIMNIVIGRARLMSAGQGAISRLGGQALGQVGVEYDSVLERFIGRRVVMELEEDGEVHEHVGIFQEYSGQFLLLLDVNYPQKETVKVKAASTGWKNKVKVEEAEGALKITNLCAWPILLQSLSDGQEEQLINAVIGGGEVADIFLKAPAENANLVFRTVYEVDMIVPRSRAMIRHRAENFETTTMKETMMDFIFDVGVVFSSDKKLEAQERKLREMLEIDPDDAVAAANLGALLIKKQEYTEAEKWLRLALKDRYALVDNGRRIEMELRELERKNTASAAPRG